MRLLFVITFLFTLNHYVFATDRNINDDIVMTSYEMIVMEQGKSNVYPVFKVQNKGNRKYNNIRLIYSKPSGISPSGQNVSVDWRRGYGKKKDFATISLEPNQEVNFNPSHGDLVYLKSSTTQALTTYSTTYYFDFDDVDGHHYKTPSKAISNFVEVVKNGESNDSTTPIQTSISSLARIDVVVTTSLVSVFSLSTNTLYVSINGPKTTTKSKDYVPTATPVTFSFSGAR